MALFSNSHLKTDISFDRPAMYRIIVNGLIEDIWFENLGGLRTRVQEIK